MILKTGRVAVVDDEATVRGTLVKRWRSGIPGVPDETRSLGGIGE